MDYFTWMIHQLKEMSEPAGESMPTVKDGVQVVGCRSVVVEVSQRFLDFTKSTLFWVLVVGVRYTSVSFVTYGVAIVSSVSGDIMVETPAVAPVLIWEARRAEEVASAEPEIVIMPVVTLARLAEPEASIVATATPDSL